MKKRPLFRTRQWVRWEYGPTVGFGQILRYDETVGTYEIQPADASKPPLFVWGYQITRVDKDDAFWATLEANRGV